MVHYYLRRKIVANPVKVLCSGAWVVVPPMNFRLAMVNCPECLKALLVLAEKRVESIRHSLAEVTEPKGPIQ